VIRYAFLWREEAARGLEEGKDRPCAIVLAAEAGDGKRVIVLPVTHTPPRDAALAVEIPADTKRRLGLDDQQSWVVVTDANRFIWPGPDLRPRPGGDVDSVAYGLLPRALFQEIRDKFLGAIDARRAALVPRSE